MTQKIVEFLFDFGSPNAYLAHRAVPQIEREHDLKFRYLPVLLGGIFQETGNRSPIEAFAGIPAKLAYEQLERERFCNRYAISDFRMNPHFPINTLALMRGAIAASRLEVFDAYVETIFSAMWVEGLDMGNIETVMQVLEEANLPAAEIVALSSDPEVKRELIENTRKAVERGTFGSPTFFVGDEIFFGKDRLDELIAFATELR